MAGDGNRKKESGSPWI